MTDVKTLDDRLREQALRQLRKDVEDWRDRCPVALSRCTVVPKDLPELTATGVNAGLLLRKLLKMAIEEASTEVGNAAVKEFLERVESLRDELNQLQN